jgi:hypothetical protein
MSEHKRPETPHRHNLHDVMDERRAETRLEVMQMRQRVDQFEAKRRVRLLSGKFNRIQQEKAAKVAARTHWLDSVKRATGLDLTSRDQNGSTPGTSKSQVPATYTTSSSLGDRAYATLKAAQHSPMSDLTLFLEAEELFLQGCEALGKTRDEVRTEIRVEQAAIARNVTLAVLRWRRACTLVLTMLAIDRKNAEKVKAFAGEMISEYTVIEPLITRLVGDHAINVKGRLVGLEYRLKSASSLFRKIMSDMDEERKKGEDGMTLLEICEHCYDILRYTCVLDTSDYVDGTKAVLKALDDFTTDELKLSQFRVKNFWGKGDAYQGINSVYSIQRGDEDPLYFELQFHTPESVKTKQETCHVSYEQFRTAVDQEEKAVAWEEMVSVWDLVPTPKGVLDIPKIYSMAFEHDVSEMTELEKHLIAHRKKIESRCSEIVAEVHTRALQAEPAISTLMQHLVVKHGHESQHQSDNLTLRDLDKRLMGELAIRRESVQTLTREYYPSRLREDDGDLLIRYSAGGEQPPPVGEHIIFGGEIDDQVVHEVVFAQVQRTPPLTYCVEVCHEMYFAFAVQDIITDTQAASDVELLSVYNWFGEASSRHRGIEATFRHLYTGVHFLVVFHTPASYRQSVDLRKAMVEMKTRGRSTKEDLDEQFRRHCALSALCNDVITPPRCLTIGEVRYSAMPARGDGTAQFQPAGSVVPYGQQAQHLPSRVTTAASARAKAWILDEGSPREQDKSSQLPLNTTSFRPRRETASSSDQQSDLVEAVTAAVQAAVTAEVSKMLALQQQQTPPGTSGYSPQVQSLAMQHGINLPPRLHTAGAMRGDADASGNLPLSARRRKHRLQQLDSHALPAGANTFDRIRTATPNELVASEIRGDTSTSLRTELQQLKLSALRKRALGLGVSEGQLDEADECADRKEEMIRLVIEKVQGVAASGGAHQSSDSVAPARLRAELGLLKTSAIRLRAVKAGASESELDNADDQQDCRSALIELVVGRSKLSAPS